MLSLLDTALIQQQHLPPHLAEGFSYAEDRGPASAVDSNVEESMVCDSDGAFTGCLGLHEKTGSVEHSYPSNETRQTCTTAGTIRAVADETATVYIAPQDAADVVKSTDKNVDKSTKLPRTTAVAKRRIISRRRRVLDD